MWRNTFLLALGQISGEMSRIVENEERQNELAELGLELKDLLEFQCAVIKIVDKLYENDVRWIKKPE